MTKKLPKKLTKRNLALSSHMHTTKVRTPIFRLWPSNSGLPSTCTQHKSRKKRSSGCGQHAFERNGTSSLRPSQLFTQTRWHKRKEGTPSFQKHTMFKPDQENRRKLASHQHDSKGLAAHVPSPSFSHHIFLLCCYIPSTVREKSCSCDSFRGQPRDVELIQHASFIS